MCSAADQLADALAGAGLHPNPYYLDIDLSNPGLASVGALRAQMCDLNARKDLNGLIVDVLGGPMKARGGRLPVMLASGEKIAVKKENLRPILAQRTLRLPEAAGDSLLTKIIEELPSEITLKIVAELGLRGWGKLAAWVDPLLDTDEMLRHALVVALKYAQSPCTSSPAETVDGRADLSALKEFAKKCPRRIYEAHARMLLMTLTPPDARMLARPELHSPPTRPTGATHWAHLKLNGKEPHLAAWYEGVDLELLATCSDIINIIEGDPQPDPTDESLHQDFGTWRGLPKSIGGVIGRGSLTHLDPDGHRYRHPRPLTHYFIPPLPPLPNTRTPTITRQRHL